MATQGTAIAFHAVLGASEASSEIPRDSRLYGWLVGSWEGDISEYDRDGSKRSNQAECHCIERLHHLFQDDSASNRDVGMQLETQPGDDR